MAKVALIDIVNLGSFNEAAEVFYEATHMTFSFPDREGNTVFRPHRERSPFCQLIQSTPQGVELCRLSDKRAGEVAMRERRPMCYTCHAGLTDVVVPVLVDDQKIGCFYSGQSLIAPPTPAGFDDVLRRVAELKLDEDELREAYRAVPQVDSHKLQMAIQLLAIMSSHLVRGEIELRRERELARAAVRKAKLERDLGEMEHRLSQAQLNPHFLFNSMNLILGQALNEGATCTARLVEDLSVLLGNSLTSIGKKVALEAEMMSAEAYVEIFRARFGKPIDLTINLPSSLRRFRVPTLILQPLVENALVHGFAAAGEAFRLQLSARRVEGSVEVSVSDSGPGMPARKLARISGALASRRRPTKLTGLPGLNQRLRYYYAVPPELRIDQSKDCFAVTIRFPSPAARCAK